MMELRAVLDRMAMLDRITVLDRYTATVELSIHRGKADENVIEYSNEITKRKKKRFYKHLASSLPSLLTQIKHLFSMQWRQLP